MKKSIAAVGLDVGGTNLKCALIDIKGKILSVRCKQTQAACGRRRVLHNIKTLIRELLEVSGRTPQSVLGIGVGTPGYILNGRVQGSPNMPGWAGAPIERELRRKFGTPCFAANDVTLAALGEFKFGAGKGLNNVVCYAIGTGIGGGLVLNGELYEGTRGMAGELGHVTVEPGGRKCSCGRRGCLEAYASATGMTAITRELLKKSNNRHSAIYRTVKGDLEQITPKIIYGCAKAGDRLANRINGMVCKYLAVAAGGVINSLSPDMVILGGGVMAAGKIILDKVRKFLPAYTLREPRENCRLAAAKLGEHAGVIGCGALVFRKLGPRRAIPR